MCGAWVASLSLRRSCGTWRWAECWDEVHVNIAVCKSLLRCELYTNRSAEIWRCLERSGYINGRGDCPIHKKDERSKNNSDFNGTYTFIRRVELDVVEDVNATKLRLCQTEEQGALGVGVTGPELGVKWLEVAASLVNDIWDKELPVTLAPVFDGRETELYHVH